MIGSSPPHSLGIKSGSHAGLARKCCFLNLSFKLAGYFCGENTTRAVLRTTGFFLLLGDMQVETCWLVQSNSLLRCD